MSKKIVILLVVILSSFHLTSSAGEVIRILAIGNSFSEDAVENYLHDIAKADDVTLIIGNMCIGGCSLERHWNNAKKATKDYSYRKFDVSGKKVTTENLSLDEGLLDEDWDIITFQQVSQNAGIYDTFFPYLNDLFDYVKGRATNKNVKYAFQMTWAYAKDSNHSGFKNYGKDQFAMYEAIVKTVVSATKTAGIDIIIPSGTAVQNGRTSFIGDKFCRDGFHMDLGVGRYLIACTWYEKLIGRSVVGNTYRPSNISPEYIDVAQKAAHYAVQNPFVVTDISQEITKQVAMTEKCH